MAKDPHNKVYADEFRREQTRKILRSAGDDAPEVANKMLKGMGIDTVYLSQFQTMCQLKADDCITKIEERVFPELLSLPMTERKQWLIDHKVYSSVVRNIRLPRKNSTRMQYLLYCPENRLLGIAKTIKRLWFIDLTPIPNPDPKGKDKILLEVEEIEQIPFPKWLHLEE